MAACSQGTCHLPRTRVNHHEIVLVYNYQIGDVQAQNVSAIVGAGNEWRPCGKAEGLTCLNMRS
jgi:hypothetical protein